MRDSGHGGGSSSEIRRVGLFVDATFRFGGRPARVLCGAELGGFMRFAAAVGSHFERFAVIARKGDDEPGEWEALPAGVDLLALPHYASLRDIGRLLTVFPATMRHMWRALDELDAVWVSGVNPFGLMLAVLGGIRRRRVVLLIRQDSPRYFQSRLPSARWAPLLLPLRALDFGFRLIGRRARTTVVGSEIAERYGAPAPNVLDFRVTQLDRAHLAPEPPADREWADPVRLLTVGRIAPEKNPLLAVEALADLNRGPGPSYALTWAGEGPLMDSMREAAARAGVGDLLDLPGYIPFAGGLLDLYRQADVLLHVSLTEGVPGVVLEAMGSGLPIVATDVGGVRGALADGAAGMLVPPRDAGALVTAVRELAANGDLRARLTARALELAGEATIESESERVAAFIAAPIPAPA